MIDMEQCSDLPSLNNSLFSNCAKLKSIKMPQKITIIGNGCFFNNVLLNSITIPDSVQIIKGWSNVDYAPFQNTLKEIKISPNSKLTTIENAAFMSSKITNIFIPKLVTYLDPGFILNCNIQRIEIDNDNPIYKTDGTVIYKDNNSTIWCVSKAVNGVFNIPSYVTTLATSCFRGVPITNITFPQDAMNFDSFNFGQTNFVEFNCPSYMTSIPPSFLNRCFLLTTVHLSPKIQSIGDHAFLECHNLVNIELPPALTKIDDMAFSSCTSLKKLVFTPNLSKIGESVFSDCTLEIDTTNNSYFLYQNHMLLSQNRTALTDSFGTDRDTILNIPIECFTIGKNTFYNKLLKKVTFAGNNLTSINESAFASSSIVEIILPSSLCILGKQCFISCSQLTSVTFNGNSLNEIPDEFFRNCAKLSTIVLPPSITSIGDYSFYQCTSIGDIGISNTQILNIGRYCFSKSSLSIFDVDHYISRILFNSFESSSVSTVSISSNSIPERCFRNCESLTSITLGEGIVSLSDECFKGCTKLAS
ncbi:ribonuclease inhibitor domain-containing protein, partial [Trichomonas vaginalis G3]|uniref:ribonuclease inhibitor domain-containing protein n=1 Tax=Trichomonas vaginalis (strain ATCC PRA-98 / G3) TaxID=412133 RepID=UPI0021E5AE98